MEHPAARNTFAGGGTPHASADLANWNGKCLQIKGNNPTSDCIDAVFGIAGVDVGEDESGETLIEQATSALDKAKREQSKYVVFDPSSR